MSEHEHDHDLDFPENSLLGSQIASAAEEDDADKAEELIRANEFLVFQQIDAESGEPELDEEDGFAVVLAEVEEDLAVVCFTDSVSAESFMNQVGNDLSGGARLPAVVLDGNELLDELPESIGILLNPTTDDECYFPPGCFQPEGDETDFDTHEVGDDD